MKFPKEGAITDLQLVLEISRLKVTNMDVAIFLISSLILVFINEHQYDVMVALLKTMEKQKYNIRKVIGQVCVKFCRLIGFFNKISFFFKFRCYDN